MRPRAWTCRWGSEEHRFQHTQAARRAQKAWEEFINLGCRQDLLSTEHAPRQIDRETGEIWGPPSVWAAGDYRDCGQQRAGWLRRRAGIAESLALAGREIRTAEEGEAELDLDCPRHNPPEPLHPLKA